MASRSRRDRILARFGRLIDAPENRGTAEAIRGARDTYEDGEMRDTDAEQLLAAYEAGVEAERKEQDKKRAVAKPYTKLFRDDTAAFATLSFKARALHATLQKPPVDPDGTIALLRPCEIESPDKAIFRSLGVSGPERRGFRKPARELFEAGFLIVEGDRVKLPHWEARQGWNGGPVPRPVCEPDARFKYPDKVDGRPTSDGRTTEGRRRDDVSTTKGRPSKSPNAPESLQPVQNGRGHPHSLLFSASKGGNHVTCRRDVPGRTTGDQPGCPQRGVNLSEKNGRVRPSARAPTPEQPEPPVALSRDDDPHWHNRGADDVDEQPAWQEGSGAHAPTPCDPDPDDGYHDDHFLHEVDPTDAHLLDEDDRRKREATRRLQ